MQLHIAPNANLFHQQADVIVNAAQENLGAYTGTPGVTPQDEATGIEGINRYMYENCGVNYRKAYDDMRTDCCSGGTHFPSGGAAYVTADRNVPGLKATPAKPQHVIIVAGPNANGATSYTAAMQNALYRSYYNSLVLAHQQNATSIAFPTISTGIYRFDPHLAAQIATRAAEDFANNYPTTLLKQITICASTTSNNAAPPSFAGYQALISP